MGFRSSSFPRRPSQLRRMRFANACRLKLKLHAAKAGGVLPDRDLFQRRDEYVNILFIIKEIR